MKNNHRDDKCPGDIVGVNMKELIELQKQLVPDLYEVLNTRYSLLKIIKFREPIGRRSLSNVSGLSERVVRGETNFLKTQGLIDIQSSGMYITSDGEKVFQGLKFLFSDADESNYLEDEIKSKLGLKDVIIVNGNCSENGSLFSEVGKAAANYIKGILKDNITISLTGGRTIKEVVNNFQLSSHYENIKVLPGRGGMGKETELQSNTLVEVLANKLSATYELLHIPDNLSKNLFDVLLNDSEIKNIFKSIEDSDILIHGIGLAQEMCTKRNLSSEVKEEIIARGAIGEAYGHFFDKEGKIVYSMPSIGIHEKNISAIPDMVAVAVGVEKAMAIIAIEKGRINSTLITDEATAQEVVRLINIS